MAITYRVGVDDDLLGSHGLCSDCVCSLKDVQDSVQAGRTWDERRWGYVKVSRRLNPGKSGMSWRVLSLIRLLSHVYIDIRALGCDISHLVFYGIVDNLC